MIVNQFRSWARTAVPSSRADGASALARAYLYSNLDAAQKVDAVATLTELLDDPSPLVRRAMAEAFASAIDAPHHIVLALADDQSSIASIVLARTPVLSEAELIDCAATADGIAQAAIAERPDLSVSVAAALAEVGAADALVALARNDSVKLPDFSLRRMIERCGNRADLREALLQRRDLPSSVRVDLVAATANALTAFVAARNWISPERMARVTREAKDKAAVIIADADRVQGLLRLAGHLREAGQLTVGFLFRAILSGKVEVFRAALADLTGMTPSRIDGLVANSDSHGFAALYRKAGLPLDLLHAFRIALNAMRETDWTMSHGTALSRDAIERVLTACESVNAGELDRLIVLLRRFEAEAARDEVRLAPALTAQAVPLTLNVEASALAPLLLTAASEARPGFHIEIPARERNERPTVDLAAIEAELLAA